jgi:ABC-type branched-subunit amino acid transport system substrate-binding protein
MYHVIGRRSDAPEAPDAGSASTTAEDSSMSEQDTTQPGRQRREFVKRSAALAAAGIAGFPAFVRAQSGPVKVGILHPVTGALAYSGGLSRLGAQIAIDEINAAGGIKSLGGAKIEALLGDAQSNPAAGTSEVEKMNEQGVSAIVGAYASAICLATTQAAAKYNIPHVVDVGVADQIVERGLKNTFRFAPGYKTVTQEAMKYLQQMNAASKEPAKTVMIIHEESLFGTGTANLLAKEDITVNAIAPALIETEMMRDNPRATPALIPVGRFGTVEEVADVVVMLATNGYINGQTINVNGGWYMS